MELPSARDINPSPEDPDAQVAERHFLGKTIEEAEALFRDNALNYHEDLMWMGIVGFRFYIEAFLRYVESLRSVGEIDFFNFVSVLEYRIAVDFSELRPIAPRLLQTCDTLLAKFEKAKPASFDGYEHPQLQGLRQAFLRMIHDPEATDPKGTSVAATASGWFSQSDLPRPIESGPDTILDTAFEQIYWFKHPSQQNLEATLRSHWRDASYDQIQDAIARARELEGACYDAGDRLIGYWEREAEILAELEQKHPGFSKKTYNKALSWGCYQAK